MISSSSLPIQIKNFKSYVLGDKKFSVNLEGDKFFVRPRSYDLYVLGETYKEKVYMPDSALKINNVVDLGAFIGDFSVWSVTHLGARKVIAVEMDTSNFEILKSNISVNKLDAKVIPLRAALAADNKGVAIQLNSFNSGMHRVAETGTIKVKSLTLEGILNAGNIKTVDLLKADIEGAERYMFIEVNKPIFKTKVGCIIMETHPTYFSEKKITNYLEKLEYKVVLSRQPFRRGGILRAVNRNFLV